MENNSEQKKDKPYSCNVCKKSFKRPQTVGRHRCVQIGQKFPCTKCKKNFKSKKLLKAHLINKHGAKTCFLELLESKHRSGRNKQQHQSMLCDICGASFPDDKKLKNHLKQHDIHSKYTCHLCNKTLNQHSTLLVHLQQHMGESPYKCEHCDKSFLSFSNLKWHRKKHVRQVPSACHICQRMFADEYLLKVHLKIHNEEKKFKCQHCDKTFTHGSTLKAHLRIHTGLKPYKCDQCGHAFAQLSSLQYHKKSHNGEKPYSCHICGKAYTRNSTLSIHLSRHTGQKRISCPQECDFKCDTLKKLRKHIEYQHPELRDVIETVLKRCRGRVSGALYADPESQANYIFSPDHLAAEQIPAPDYTIQQKQELDSNVVYTEIYQRNSQSSAACDKLFEITLINTESNGTVEGSTYEIIYPGHALESDVHDPASFGQVISEVYTGNASNTYLIDSTIDPSQNQITVQKFPGDNSIEVEIQDFRGVSNEETQFVVLDIQPSQDHNTISVSNIENMEEEANDDDDFIVVDEEEEKSTDANHVSNQNAEIENVKEECTDLPKPSIMMGLRDRKLLKRSFIVKKGTRKKRQVSSDKNCGKVINVTSRNNIEAVVTEHKESSERKSISKKSKENSVIETVVMENKKTFVKNKKMIKAAKVPKAGFKENLRSSSSKKAVKKIKEHDRCTRMSKKTNKESNKISNEHGIQQKSLLESKESLNKVSHEAKQYKLRNEQKAEKREESRLIECSSCKLMFSSQSYLAAHECLHNEQHSYVCSTCNQKFAHPENLLLHQTTHKRINSHWCSHCGGIFNTLEELSSHIKSQHDDKHPFLCSLCQFSCIHLRELKQHIKTHVIKESLACEVCKKKMKSPKDYKIHMRSHKMDRPFKCNICDKAFKVGSCLKLHVQKNHTGEKLFQCGICQDSFVAASRLEHHMRSHSGIKPYTCDFCGKMFTESRFLKTHVAIHKEERPFLCNICTQTFKHKSTLNAHLRRHAAGKVSFRPRIRHTEIDGKKRLKYKHRAERGTGYENCHQMKCDTCKLSFLSLDDLTAHKCFENDGQPYCCSFCDKKFINHENLLLHQTTHKETSSFLCSYCGNIHDSLQELSSHIAEKHEGKDPFVCNICQFSCIYLGELKKHIKTHEVKELLACEICKQTMKSTKDYKVHMNSHEMDKPFKCSMCEKTFKVSSCLKLHVQKSHTGEKVFKCGICQETFIAASKLERHMRSHNGVRPFSCEFCGKTFTESRFLKTHVVTHKDERPFSCEYCGQSFKHKSTLNAHLRTHTGTKPYTCPVCGTCFAQLSSLVYHQRIHDGIKRFVCHVCGSAFTRNTTLTMHMSVHTGIKRLSCNLCSFRCNRMKGLRHHIEKEHNRPNVTEPIPVEVPTVLEQIHGEYQHQEIEEEMKVFQSQRQRVLYEPLNEQIILLPHPQQQNSSLSVAVSLLQLQQQYQPVQKHTLDFS